MIYRIASRAKTIDDAMHWLVIALLKNFSIKVIDYALFVKDFSNVNVYLLYGIKLYVVDC